MCLLPVGCPHICAGAGTDLLRVGSSAGDEYAHPMVPLFPTGLRGKGRSYTELCCSWLGADRKEVQFCPSSVWWGRLLGPRNSKSVIRYPISPLRILRHLCLPLSPRACELCNIWQPKQDSGLRLQPPMIPCGWGNTTPHHGLREGENLSAHTPTQSPWQLFISKPRPPRPPPFPLGGGKKGWRTKLSQP